MARLIKKAIIKSLEKLGYSLQPMHNSMPIDLRRTNSDPRQLMYVSHIQPVIINLPINQGRGFLFFSFSRNGAHPYVVAAIKAQDSENVFEKVRSVLKAFYGMVSFEETEDVLGLEKNALDPDISKKLYEYDRLHYPLLPWAIKPLDKWMRTCKKGLMKERERLNKENKYEAWWVWDKFINIEDETYRLVRLLDSIKKNGYLRNNNRDGDIRANILIDNNNWRWQLVGGNHRASVLSALDYKYIPVRVNQLVNRNDVAIWPQVLAGVYTKEAALKVFDYCFNASPPPVTHQWVSEIRSYS